MSKVLQRTISYHEIIYANHDPWAANLEQAKEEAAKEGLVVKSSKNVFDDDKKIVVVTYKLEPKKVGNEDQQQAQPTSDSGA